MFKADPTVPIFSMEDIMITLKSFADNGGYDMEEILYFVSCMTGLSEDEILELEETYD